MQKVVKHPLCRAGGTLTAYLHDFDTAYIKRGPRPGVLVIPEGGYQRCVEREADPVAAQENDAPLGLVPLIQASTVIVSIRESAEEWNTAPDKLAVLGFSAGGHLAGACAVLWVVPELVARMDTKRGKNRPDAAVLCYPVTFTGEKSHRGSIERLCRKEDEPFLIFLHMLKKIRHRCFCGRHRRMNLCHARIHWRWQCSCRHVGCHTNGISTHVNVMD